MTLVAGSVLRECLGCVVVVAESKLPRTESQDQKVQLKAVEKVPVYPAKADFAMTSRAFWAQTAHFCATFRGFSADFRWEMVAKKEPVQEPAAVVAPTEVTDIMKRAWLRVSSLEAD